MNNAVIAALAIVLGLGAWASTTDSDQPGASPATTDSGQTAAATATADQQAPKPIRITKVSYDPPGPDTDTNAHLNRERIAIKNFGQQPRQLRGWTLRGSSGDVFHFPGFRLSPNTTVTVHTGHGRRTRHDLYWGRENYVWNNTGDRTTLRNREGRRIDRCRWGDGDGTKSC